MLFVRTYHGMLGGHLKVFDYMQHVRASGRFEPVLYLTPNSTVSPSPLLPGVRVVSQPVDADAYFVAGFNWRLLDEAGVDIDGKPVVNLIQGMRHALPGDPRGEFLPRPALRICVSSAVYDAVASTGRAAGPIVLVRNGIDLRYLAEHRPPVKRRCVFIAGSKNPQLAHELELRLRHRDYDVDLCCEHLPREEFLRRMAACDVAVTLPYEFEGFFLPALEAMAVGCAIVLPHCPGAASYCTDRVTCLCVAYDLDAIERAVAELRSDEALRERIATGGEQAAAEHSLERERREFLVALNAFIPGYHSGSSAI